EELAQDGPQFVFTATNLQDGALWWFFRQGGAHGQIPLCTAVAASSAFPPMLSPVVIPDPHDGSRKIVLSDAGVYDNLGLAPVEQTRKLAVVATRLTRFPETLQDQLINWGYAVSDAAMRKWVDHEASPPASFPYPKSGVGS